MSNRKLLLSPIETAQALGIGRTLVYDLMREGQLSNLKIGRLRKIPLQTIEQWISSQIQAQKQETSIEDQSE